jgi:hypothetical protein
MAPLSEFPGRVFGGHGAVSKPSRLCDLPPLAGLVLETPPLCPISGHRMGLARSMASHFAEPSLSALGSASNWYLLAILASKWALSSA